MNRAHYGAVAAGALLLTLPGSLRQEPTNPAAAVVKWRILVRVEEMRWEDCSAAIPRGPKCATLEGDPLGSASKNWCRARRDDTYAAELPAYPRMITASTNNRGV